MLAGCDGAGCNPSVGETEDHGNFEAGLGYTASSRPVKAI